MKEVYWYKATVAFTGRKDEIGAEGVTLGYADMDGEMMVMN